jgi:hypothetical protein
MGVKVIQVLNDRDLELKIILKSNLGFNSNSGFRVIGIES